MVISQNSMGKRILIADDSVTIQKAFAMTLVGEDFALTAARSADEGLTLARQTRPDLVIADASMPGRSGYELCAALKADAALRGIPVYILSSTHQPYDEAKGHQVGADGNVLKPWESGALIDKLKDAAGRPAGAARPAAAPPAMPGGRPAATLPAAALDNEYDVDMDAPRDTAPTAPRSTATSIPAVRPAAPTAAPAGGMRPSLIPGMRPGAMPPARPGTSPSRTLGATTPMQAAVPPRPTAGAAPMGRTLFGLPAASMPFPGSTRPASVAPAPAPSPVAAPEPMLARAPAPAVSGLGASNLGVSNLVDQKVAAFAAKGPEYEALAKLSREVIEQIVWEIVPELAEVIIREQVAKRGGL
jgi:CheY-like chemotaxis protein